jgi:hypothetical protein
MILRLVQFITEHDENNTVSVLQFAQTSSNGFAELSNLHSVDRSSLCIYIITSFNVGNFAFLAQVFAPNIRSRDIFLRGLRSGDAGNLSFPYMFIFVSTFRT